MEISQQAEPDGTGQRYTLFISRGDISRLTGFGDRARRLLESGSVSLMLLGLADMARQIEEAANAPRRTEDPLQPLVVADQFRPDPTAL